MFTITYRQPNPIHGRKPADGFKAKTQVERNRAYRKRKQAQRLDYIAVLDFETDPFDDTTKAVIKPFLAVLYSENFEPVVIWDEDLSNFVDRVLSAIVALPGKYTIYAHNGGKFDFLFLIHKLRGFVQFKGRGIMAAQVGNHELRDSFHLLPEKLANYKKDHIDYANMRKGARDKHREQIVRYCIKDCAYLLNFVTSFLRKYGFKLSIGQASMAELKKHYTVKTLGENMDEYLRRFYFGGRVDCVAGRGHFVGRYRLYDVNSMYPFAMANYLHPVGNSFVTRGGVPSDHTVFIDLECENFGALVCRTDNNETSANEERGRFLTTIWEYKVARKYGLIQNVRFHACIDCYERTTFEKFIVPLYNNRLLTKGKLDDFKQAGKTEGDNEFDETRKDDLFYKYLLNNSYGKFAQNPRRFKENFITDPGEKPPAEYEGFGMLPSFENDHYAIWERPSPGKRFNNVATAASITGAARAILLEALQNAIDPIYCDTDSIICRELPNVELSSTKLGAWDLEKEFDEVLIAGKKLYACRVHGLPAEAPGHTIIRSKGAPREQLDWNKMQALLDGQIIETLNKAPTFTKTGKQFYMKRNLRATGTQIPMRRPQPKRKIAHG